MKDRSTPFIRNRHQGVGLVVACAAIGYLVGHAIDALSAALGVH